MQNYSISKKDILDLVHKFVFAQILIVYNSRINQKMMSSRPCQLDSPHS